MDTTTRTFTSQLGATTSHGTNPVGPCPRSRRARAIGIGIKKFATAAGNTKDEPGMSHTMIAPYWDQPR